jgi:hypothetical protein
VTGDPQILSFNPFEHASIVVFPLYDFHLGEHIFYILGAAGFGHLFDMG